MPVEFTPDTETAEKPAINFTPDQAPPEQGGILSGVASAVGQALNPINLIKGALDIGGESDISKIQRYSKSIGDVIFGGKPVEESLRENIPEVAQERAAVTGQLGRKAQAATLTGLGLQTALLAAPFIHGKVLPRPPGLAETIFERPPPPVAETAATAEPSPPIQSETAAEGVIADAAKERQIAESRVAEHPGDGEGRPPAEAGGRGRVEPGAEVRREVPAEEAVAPPAPAEAPVVEPAGAAAPAPVEREFPSYTTEELKQRIPDATPEVAERMRTEVAAREAGISTPKITPQIVPPIDLQTILDTPGQMVGPIERLRAQAIKDLGLKSWANPQNFTEGNSAKIQAKMLEIARSHPDFNQLFEQHGERIFHKGTGQPILGPREASKEGWETGMPPGPGAVDPYAAKPAEEFALAKPESVEEQKARLAQEAAQGEAAAQRAAVEQGAAAPIRGTAGDLGQMELGGELGPREPELFSQPAAPVTRPEAAGITDQMAADLREAGFSQPEIDQLTPERAQEILRIGKQPEPAKEIPTVEAAPPVEVAPGLSNEAQAVYDQAKATPDEHGVVNATHLSPADRRALAERGLSFSVDRENNIVARYPQVERAKDLREQVTGSREVGEQTVTPAMEAKMEREHRQELQSAYEEHALQGGEELGTVLKRIGLPSLSSPRQAFKGELASIREEWKGTRGDPNRQKIRYADLFKKNAPDIDVLAQELRRAGFDVQTPADALDLIQRWVREGKPIYGSEARGEALAAEGMGAARVGEIPEAKLTGMKNRIVDEERTARGWLPLMGPARQAMGKVWDRAMGRIEAGDANGENLGSKMVDDVLSGAKREFNEEDHAVLLHERIRQQNERSMAADRVNDVNTSAEERVEAQNAWAAAEDRVNQTELALHDAGTYAGRALQIRQLLARDDYTFEGIERRARAAKGGAPLTPEESAAIKEQATQLQTNFEAEQARITQIEEKNGQEAFDLSVSGLKKRAAKEKGPVNLDEQREKIGEGLLTRAEEGDTLQDAGGLVHQLALNFVRSGVTEREALIDAVHGVVGDVFGVTRAETRDAISGYGKFKQLDPEVAKAQLRQLKGEMQQIGKLENMASGVAPKKTGIERRTPSDEERRLIKQVNEMKKKGGFEVTDPARQLKTTMDAIETRLRNQIRDLDYAITKREPIVNKKGEIVYSPEANRLREMRDNLKTQYDEIFGKKGMSDEQKLRVAEGAAERSLKDWESQLADAQQGKFRNQDKTRLTNPEIEAIRAKRDAVKAEVDALKAQDPAQQKVQLQKQLAIRKQQALQRNADLQEQIARGDFTRPERKVPVMDKELLQIRAEGAKLREEVDLGIRRRMMEQRAGYEKMFDTFLKYRRGFVLAWPTIFAKLASAAFLRTFSEPVEAGIGAALRKIPGVAEVAEKAPIEGQTSLGAVARSTAKAFTAGLNDAVQTLKTGKSDLDRLYGRKDVMPREWIDFFGTLHAMMKAPIKRLGFELAMENQMAHGLRNGLDIADPIIQTQMALRAYAHGERLIFLQNNRVVSAYNQAIRRLEAPVKETGRPSVAGKLAATAAQAPLPIVKVPTNIVSEIFDYSLGSFTGGARLANALRKGVETLGPAEADSILRQLKKGSLGGALLLTGYFLRNQIGGYYQHHEKRDPEDVKPGGIKIGDTEIPHNVFHSAISGPLMIGATIGRVQDTQVKGVPKGLGEGLLRGMLGPIEEVPFFTGPERILKTLEAPSLTTALGETVGGIVSPGAVQYLARVTDKDAQGNVVKRRPSSFWEGIMENVPFARRSVPEKAQAGGKGSRNIYGFRQER